MKHLEITFKSGATVKVDVESYEVTKYIGGGMQIKWNTTGSKHKVVTCDIDAIDIVLEVRE